MGIESLKLNNREKTDWDYTREVRASMKKGKSFDAAYEEMIKNNKLQDRLAFRKEIGRISGEISGQARKKVKDKVEVPKPPREPYVDIHIRANKLRREQELKKNPLFAAQVGEELDKEDRQRGY